MVGIFALFLCFYLAMARDSWLAFIPPLLCILTTHLKSVLPIKTSSFCYCSLARSCILATAGSELSAVASQGRVWMAWRSSSTLLGNGLNYPGPAYGQSALFQVQIIEHFILEYSGNELSLLVELFLQYVLCKAS